LYFFGHSSVTSGSLSCVKKLFCPHYYRSSLKGSITTPEPKQDNLKFKKPARLQSIKRLSNNGGKVPKTSKYHTTVDKGEFLIKTPRLFQIIDLKLQSRGDPLYNQYKTGYKVLYAYIFGWIGLKSIPITSAAGC
jgi:hypothetical protein